MGGIIKSDANALSWFQRGAVNGDMASMYSLGFLFESGRGGAPKDDKQALEWFRLAGSHGYADAKKYVELEVIVESFKHQGNFFRHEERWLWVNPLTSKPEGARICGIARVSCGWNAARAPTSTPPRPSKSWTHSRNGEFGGRLELASTLSAYLALDLKVKITGEALRP